MRERGAESDTLGPIGAIFNISIYIFQFVSSLNFHTRFGPISDTYRAEPFGQAAIS